MFPRTSNIIAVEIVINLLKTTKDVSKKGIRCNKVKLFIRPIGSFTIDNAVNSLLNSTIDIDLELPVADFYCESINAIDVSKFKASERDE